MANLVTSTKLEPTYELTDRGVVGQNVRHKFLEFKVKGLNPKKPEWVFPIGTLGVTRLMSLTVQPIGEHFSVVWNGDVGNPVFKFDSYPEVAHILVEVWGI